MNSIKSRPMTQEEIAALLSRMPNSTESKEYARKLLQKHSVKEEKSPVSSN